MNVVSKFNQKKVTLLIVFVVIFISVSYFNLSHNMIRVQATNESFNYESLND